MLTLSVQHLKNRLAYKIGFWDFSPSLAMYLESVWAGSRIQGQIYDNVLLMEIFDWGKLEYNPFILQVCHQSLVPCQLYKEDLNLFLPLHFKKRLGATKFLPNKFERTF